MDHYIDIDLLPDPEFSGNVLMNALFAKFHRALVSLGSGKIGVSFPQAKKKTLGTRLRVHGEENALQALEQLGWLKGLRDYCVVSELRAVPDDCQFCVVRRAQAKSSAERLRRRSVSKGWLSEEEAKIRITSSSEKLLALPFVQLRSASSGHTFRLFIDQSKQTSTSESGNFSAYGLSQGATIPWF